MVDQQDFIEFSQKYPECYSIAKSPLLLRFLKAFTEQPFSINELLSYAPQVEELDIKLAVLALESAKVIKKSKSIQSEVYHLTPKGKEFLEKYGQAKNA